MVSSTEEDPDDLFTQITKGMADEFPDPDPYVYVHLTDGTVLSMKDLSGRGVAERLFTYGYTELQDSADTYCFLFRHGVSAIITRKEPTA